MVASVELVLERGERLELLVDKTDNLQQQVRNKHVMFFGECVTFEPQLFLRFRAASSLFFFLVELVRPSFVFVRER